MNFWNDIFTKFDFADSIKFRIPQKIHRTKNSETLFAMIGRKTVALNLRPGGRYEQTRNFPQQVDKHEKYLQRF